MITFENYLAEQKAGGRRDSQGAFTLVKSKAPLRPDAPVASGFRGLLLLKSRRLLSLHRR